MPFLTRIFAVAAALACFSVSGLQAQDSSGTAGKPVAARRIDRGSVLTKGDVAGPSAAVEGWVSRRVIQPGEPLEPPAVSPPLLVRSRQGVTVRLTSGTIHLLIDGTALADGSLGDTIYIRLDARRRIRAVVSRDGIVTAVALPSR